MISLRTLLAVAALAAGTPALAQDPFVGEIRWVGFDFAPRGWAQCNGQLLPINQNQALFALLGTTYGGNGQTTFALPNLQSRTVVHVGQGPGLTDRTLGETGGAESVTLTENELPVHAHSAYAMTGRATRAFPANGYPSTVSTYTGDGYVANDVRAYKQQGTPVAMNSGMIGSAGGGQAHENMAPFTTLNCIIALQGIFPSRN